MSQYGYTEEWSLELGFFKLHAAPDILMLSQGACVLNCVQGKSLCATCDAQVACNIGSCHFKSITVASSAKTESFVTF